MKLYIAIFTLLQIVSVANSYKILAIFAPSSKSHLFSFLPLAHELAGRGHEVTLMHSQPKLAITSSIKSVVIPELAKIMDEMTENSEAKKQQSSLQLISQMTEFMVKTCRVFIQSAETQALLKAGKQYDVVIVLSIINDCGVAIAPLLGKHLIIHHPIAFFFLSPSPAPSPPSIVPHAMFAFPSQMNFKQRFANFAATLLIQSLYKYYFVRSVNHAIAELVPEAPTVLESFHNASLTIVNQDVITSSPRPTVPNMIAAPGMPCTPPKPLPKELEQFMQTSGDDGVIVVGLGSVAKFEDLPNEVVQKFLTVFGRLKQKVIWKYEGSLKVPANVKTMNWMPQQDILGHPKAKLFISHGGMASMQEAVYHGVPVIGIPMHGDQPGNLARMKEIGAGEYVDVNEVTEDELYNTVTNILNDQSYYDRMKRFSAIFKDTVQPSVKKAAFWVEYVVRHDGARHLRTIGQDMCPLQYFLVDVIAFLTLVPLLSLYLVYRLAKYVWRKHKTCQRKKADTKKTQ